MVDYLIQFISDLINPFAEDDIIYFVYIMCKTLDRKVCLNVQPELFYRGKVTASYIQPTVSVR